MKVDFKIDVEALERIRLWTAMAPGEIQGFGRVILQSNGVPLVTSAFILKQVCTASSSTMDEDAVGEMLASAAAAGVPMEELRFWWHSHASMDTFWSGTDTGTIEHLLNDSFLISMVVNKAKKMLSRVDIKTPLRLTLEGNDGLYVASGQDVLEAECKKDFSELVATRPMYEGVNGYGYAKSHASGRNFKQWDDEWDEGGYSWDGKHRLFCEPGASEDGNRAVEPLGSGYSIRAQHTESVVSVVGRRNIQSVKLGKDTPRVYRLNSGVESVPVSRAKGNGPNGVLRGLNASSAKDMEDYTED